MSESDGQNLSKTKSWSKNAKRGLGDAAIVLARLGLFLPVLILLGLAIIKTPVAPNFIGMSQEYLTETAIALLGASFIFLVSFSLCWDELARFAIERRRRMSDTALYIIQNILSLALYIFLLVAIGPAVTKNYSSVMVIVLFVMGIIVTSVVVVLGAEKLIVPLVQNLRTQILKVFFDREQTIDQDAVQDVRRYNFWSLSLFFVIAFILYILYAFVPHAYFNSFSITLLAFAYLMPLIAALFALQRNEWPVMFVIVALALISLFNNQFHDPVRLIANDDGNAQTQPRQSFKDFAARKSATMETPGLVLALPGGGITAAHSGATFLDLLETRAEDTYKRIGFVSAVSGGAVGAAIHNAAVRDLAPGERQAVIDKTLSEDFLSSPVWHMLGPSLFQVVVPLPLEDVLSLWGLMPYEIDADRSESLEKRIALAWREAALTSDAEAANPLLSPLSSTPEDYALVYNAFSVERRQRVLLSNIDVDTIPDTIDFHDLIGSGEDINHVHAAVISARFPFITPPAYVKASKTSLVDGGFFDNSGLLTAEDIKQQIQSRKTPSGEEPAACSPSDVALLAVQPFSTIYPVRTEPGDPSGIETATHFSALLESWTARDRDLIKRFDQCYCQGCHARLAAAAADFADLNAGLPAALLFREDLFTNRSDDVTEDTARTFRDARDVLEGLAPNLQVSGPGDMQKLRSEIGRLKSLLNEALIPFQDDMESPQSLSADQIRARMPDRLDTDMFRNFLIYPLDDTENRFSLTWHLTKADQSRIRQSFDGLGYDYDLPELYVRMIGVYSESAEHAVRTAAAKLDEIISLTETNAEEALARFTAQSTEADPAWHDLAGLAAAFMRDQFTKEDAALGLTRDQVGKAYPLFVMRRVLQTIGRGGRQAHGAAAFLYTSSVANKALLNRQTPAQ